MYGLASKISGNLNDHYNEAIVKRLPRETDLVFYVVKQTVSLRYFAMTEGHSCSGAN